MSAPTTAPASNPGLGGLSFAPMAASPAPLQTPSVLQAASPPAPQQAQDDLLGLF